MSSETSRYEGYIVDIACLRKYPEEKMLMRVKEHTKQCALDGHCIESGYALVLESGEKVLLEPDATALVVAAVLLSDREAGITAEVERVLIDGSMHTTRVRLT